MVNNPDIQILISVAIIKQLIISRYKIEIYLKTIFDCKDGVWNNFVLKVSIFTTI